MRSHGAKKQTLPQRTIRYHRNPLVPIDNRPTERPSTRSPAHTKPHRRATCRHVSFREAVARGFQALPKAFAKGVQTLPSVARGFRALPRVSKETRCGCRAMAMAVLDAKQRRSHGDVSPESAPGRRVFCGRFSMAEQRFSMAQRRLGPWAVYSWVAHWRMGRLYGPSAFCVLCHPLCPFGRLERFLVLLVLRCGREAIGGTRMPFDGMPFDGMPSQALSSDCLGPGLRHC